MDFLNRIFGGGSRGSGSDPDGLYYYVRPQGCDEVIRVRINRMNDLSLADDGKSYWVHKVVRGIKCRQTVDLNLYFDSNKRLTNTEIENGDLVDVSAYDEWMAQQNPNP